MEQSAATTQVEVIAERVNHLFDEYRKAEGRKATDEQVAAHVAQVTGKACSRHWIRDLRNARNRAPELARLEAIADFFGVARRYLFDDRGTTIEDDKETARRVNLLFTQFTDADGHEANDQQVADHIAQVTELPCPAQWVRDLREAKVRGPDAARLEAIASFFGVSRRYLYDDTVAAAVEEDIETGRAIKKLEAHDIHLRQLGGLSPDKLRAVAAVIRSLAAETPDSSDH